MVARKTIQNFCAMVIYAIVSVLVMPSTAFSIAEVSVQPAVIKSQAIGEQLTVEVKITGGKGIAGFQFTLSYDTTALEYVSVKIGDYLPFDVFEVPPKASDGVIRYAVAAPRGKLSEKADGILATATFKVLDKKKSIIRLTQVKLADGNAEEFTSKIKKVSESDEPDPKDTSEPKDSVDPTTSDPTKTPTDPKLKEDPLALAKKWHFDSYDVYESLTGIKVKIDADIGEWANVPTFIGVQNETGINGSGPKRSFEEYAGGKWIGPFDHTVAFKMTWDPTAIYLCLIVIDDQHQNDDSGWNGDAAQLAFEPTGKRTKGLPLFLYNVALSSNDGRVIIDNQQPAGGTAGLQKADVAIARDESQKKTYYEFRFTAKEMAPVGMSQFKDGMEFGMGICVGDGDNHPVSQKGFKGWGGWFPHSIVFAKQAEKTGLVKLVSTKAVSVEARGKLVTTWGNLKR